MRPSNAGACPRARTASLASDGSSSSLASASAARASRPSARRCGFPECEKTAKRGGLCISHGGGKKCSVDGCTTSVVSRGCCVAHGGGKRCQAPACAKSAQTGGFCWIHGGGKKCGYLGCKKRAQSGGACISHGGGKRCRMEGCNKVVQYDGLCVGHGGYRKCHAADCSKRALANNYCHAHGGNSLCLVAQCSKRAVRGGLCTEHKALRARAASTLRAPVPASSRPSIQLFDTQEAAMKPEPPLSAFPTQQQQQERQWPYLLVPATSSAKASPELRAAATFTPVNTQLGPTSPLAPGPTPAMRLRSQRIMSPLECVCRDPFPGGESSPMVTPVLQRFEPAKHFDQRHYQQFREQEHKYPVLPGIQTLQGGCSPWMERPSISWSGPAAVGLPSQISPQFGDGFQRFRGDEGAVEAGFQAPLCCVPSCGRHAQQNGLCVAHNTRPGHR